MDFDSAIEAHVKWKMMLRAYLGGSGSFDTSEVERDDRCELGVWIHGEGCAFQEMGEYSDLRAKHVELHKLTAQIIRLVDEGKAEEAEAQIDGSGRYSQLSTEIVTAIRAMRTKAGA